MPYLFYAESRRYRPDFIGLVDDRTRRRDLLHLVVEIKGYRGEDAKEKKSTMETYWVPGVNNRGDWGRWAFVELVDVWEIERESAAKIQQAIDCERFSDLPVKGTWIDDGMDRVSAFL